MHLAHGLKASTFDPTTSSFRVELAGRPISARANTRASSMVEEIGLDTTAYGTHSMHRTKAAMIYKKTKNLRAVQILLGHNKLESTVRYLGIEVDDALDIAEQLDV